METIKEICIAGDYIKLDALLKFANLTASGGEAKIRIANGEVFVNDEPCTARGKKLRAGDRVKLDNILLRITNE